MHNREKVHEGGTTTNLAFGEPTEAVSGSTWPPSYDGLDIFGIKFTELKSATASIGMMAEIGGFQTYWFPDRGWLEWKKTP